MMGKTYLKALRRGFNTMEISRAYGVSEAVVYSEISRERESERGKPLETVEVEMMPYCGKIRTLTGFGF